MANAVLDMNNQSYKYFETNPSPLQSSAGIDQHMMELTQQLPDPSLHASSFWRAFPHILGFIFVYLFGGMYYNEDIFYYFPIMFFFPSLIFIFICLPKQYIFDRQNIASFINNLSWGFWIGLSSFAFLTTLNITMPFIIQPAIEATCPHFGTHHMWQEQIIFTSLVLTSLIDEIIKSYLMHRSFQRFYGLGISTSSINTLLLNCTLNGTGIAIAKGFIAICLIGVLFIYILCARIINVLYTGNKITNNDDECIRGELIYEYRYALVHYIPKAFIKNDDLYPVLMVVIYGLCILPFHTILGSLWGIGFIRRFVLEHTICFGQILMFPWFFHFILNIIIAQFFYNIIDNGLKDNVTIYSVTIAIPITLTIISIVIFIVLFKRQIDRSISELHSSA